MSAAACIAKWLDMTGLLDQRGLEPARRNNDRSRGKTERCLGNSSIAVSHAGVNDFNGPCIADLLDQRRTDASREAGEPGERPSLFAKGSMTGTWGCRSGNPSKLRVIKLNSPSRRNVERFPRGDTKGQKGNGKSGISKDRWHKPELDTEPAKLKATE